MLPPPRWDELGQDDRDQVLPVLVLNLAKEAQQGDDKRLAGWCVWMAS